MNQREDTLKEQHQQQRARYMRGELTHHQYYAWLCDAIGVPERMVPEMERFDMLRPEKISCDEIRSGSCRLHGSTHGLKGNGPAIGTVSFRCMIDKQMKPYDWRAETEKMHRATFKPPKWRNEE